MPRSSIVVFSGGSAANNIVDVFGEITDHKKWPLSYIIPTSDNGGSSSEIIRYFGGPGIGDARSRLVRLIPDDPNGIDKEQGAVKLLFNHRLAGSPEAARLEWLEIVEARHKLWHHISSEKQELIRSFLNTINLEIVKRTRPSSIFNFESASVGNLFLTGARLFTGSFESAIYLLRSITGVPSSVSVIPAINSNFSHHICAGLEDGTSITGQNAISHPSAPTTVPSKLENLAAHSRTMSFELNEHDRVEDANLPGSLPSLRRQYIKFQKDCAEDLPSRIERVWYINPYGQEIKPTPNPRVIDMLNTSQCVIYSIGSLYTSIIPCLVLKGVGAAISSPSIRFKILILNGSLDRETRSSTKPFSALDFLAAIAEACHSSRGLAGNLERLDWSQYITHVIHLDGCGTPVVDKEELRRIDIEPVKIYGRKADGASGMIYDKNALTQALQTIIGRRDPRMDRSRRNTFEH